MKPFRISVFLTSREAFLAAVPPALRFALVSQRPKRSRYSRAMGRGRKKGRRNSASVFIDEAAEESGSGTPAASSEGGPPRSPNEYDCDDPFINDEVEEEEEEEAEEEEPPRRRGRLVPMRSDVEPLAGPGPGSPCAFGIFMCRIDMLWTMRAYILATKGC